MNRHTWDGQIGWPELNAAKTHKDRIREFQSLLDCDLNIPLRITSVHSSKKMKGCWRVTAVGSRRAINALQEHLR